jgi:hypothetical protein
MIQRGLAAFWWQCVSKPPLVSDAIGGLILAAQFQRSHFLVFGNLPETKACSFAATVAVAETRRMT